MLPSHFPSRTSSPTNDTITKPLSEKKQEELLKKRTPILPIQPLTFKSILKDPNVLKPFLISNLINIIIGFVLVWFLIYILFGGGRNDKNGFIRKYDGSKNWGDYVALGKSRNAMLAQTPKPYASLGDKYLGSTSNSLYHGLKSSFSDPLSVDTKSSEKEVKNQRNLKFESERHGILGGSSSEWNSGIVGMGEWLGEKVDMRKESEIIKLGEIEEDKERLEKRLILTEHILKNAWTYTDLEDEKNSIELLLNSEKTKTKQSLPLRDRVRNDEILMKEAAKSWSRIYGVMEGEGLKSALEISVEKLVRRVEVVVFSKTTCSFSTKAKDLLHKMKLTPEIHLVELDLRPDGKNLQGLLKRRTLHSTFPNIIIGGKSIGGFDDLELLIKENKLKTILEDAGVIVN